MMPNPRREDERERVNEKGMLVLKILQITAGNSSSFAAFVTSSFDSESSAATATRLRDELESKQNGSSRKGASTSKNSKSNVNEK